jgi:hypothetical protein
MYCKKGQPRVDFMKHFRPECSTETSFLKVFFRQKKFKKYFLVVFLEINFEQFRAELSAVISRN